MVVRPVCGQVVDLLVTVDRMLAVILSLHGDIDIDVDIDVSVHAKASIYNSTLMFRAASQ
jgi:hypothetical protein